MNDCHVENWLTVGGLVDRCERQVSPTIKQDRPAESPNIGVVAPPGLIFKEKLCVSAHKFSLFDTA